MQKQNETLLKKRRYPTMPVEIPNHAGKRNKKHMAFNISNCVTGDFIWLLRSCFNLK